MLSWACLKDKKIFGFNWKITKVQLNKRHSWLEIIAEILIGL
jgi:hypothetical protein